MTECDVCCRAAKIGSEPFSPWAPSLLRDDYTTDRAAQWMLLGSNGLLCIWASGYSRKSTLPIASVANGADLKHKYWYMHVPNYGIMATPIDLYVPSDLTFARILNVFVTRQSTMFANAHADARQLDYGFKWPSTPRKDSTGSTSCGPSGNPGRLGHG